MTYHSIETGSDATAASFGTFAFKDPISRVVTGQREKQLGH